jgi:hypothetical protein
MGSPAMARAQQLQDSQYQQKRDFNLAPLSQALEADKTRLALYADPNDPTKPVAGKEAEYQQTMSRMADTIGQMRATVLGQKAPAAVPDSVRLLDMLHIGKHLAGHLQANQTNKVSDYYAKNKQMAGEYGAGNLPFEATPAGQAASFARQTQLDVEKARVAGEAPDYKNFRLADGKTIVPIDVKHQTPPVGAVLVGSESAQPKAAPPQVKPLEAGGAPYGVEDIGSGVTYLQSQMNLPTTPAPVKEAWNSIQTAIKAKADAAQRKEDESNERQLRSIQAIASRMGQSEQFQEQMASYREGLGEFKKLDQDARDAQSSYDMQAAASQLPGNKSAFDTALITDYTRVLSKGGRMTQAEIKFAQQVGSLGLRADRAMSLAASGQLPPKLRKMYLDYLKARAGSMRKEADDAKPDMPTVSVGGKGKQQPKKANDPLGVL